MQTSEVHYADEKNPEREGCARSAKVEFVFLPDVYIGEREREREVRSLNVSGHSFDGVYYCWCSRPYRATRDKFYIRRRLGDDSKNHRQFPDQSAWKSKFTDQGVASLHSSFNAFAPRER